MPHANSYRRVTSIAAIALLLVSCSLVPKESVELSTTVGRDIATAHQSHRALAMTLFGRMKQDVNRFVDDVYAPFQIQFVLAKQKELQTAGDHNNMLSVMDTAVRQPQNTQAQKDVISFMQALVEAVHEDVEEYRAIRLQPVLAQEQEVLTSIERVYDDIERGNATVTAHLASVVKVHEAQDELLASVDLAGLREKIGVNLSNASAKVADFVGKAKKIEGTTDETVKTVNQLTERLDTLLKGE